MKISFIVKGLIKKKAKLLEEIKTFFPGSQVFETSHAGHAVELAANAVKANFTHIIAVGGDGTLSEVVNGMASTGNDSLPVLGLLSYGTANDFSKTAGLDGSVKQLKELLFKNSVSKIDIGHVKFLGMDRLPAERFFINIGDIGIGGYIVENINKSKKKLGADMTFFLETLKGLFRYKKTKVKCRFNGFEWEGNTLSIVIANGKYFGSGLCISPDSTITDGKFGIVILGNVTVIDYLKNLSKIKRGEKMQHAEVFYKEANEIDIIPEESSCSIDLDGEFIGYAPATFKIIPARINFLINQ